MNSHEGSIQTISSTPVGSTQRLHVVKGSPYSSRQKLSPLYINAIHGLGVTQIVIGVLAFIFQIVAIAVKTPLGTVAAGIWTGIFFIITGSFGISSGRIDTNCSTVTHLVLNLLSSLLSCVLIAISSSSLVLQNDYYNTPIKECLQEHYGYGNYDYNDKNYGYDYINQDYYDYYNNHYGSMDTDHKYYELVKECRKNRNVGTAAEIILIILGLLVLIISIVATGFGCGKLRFYKELSQSVIYSNQSLGGVAIQGASDGSQPQQSISSQLPSNQGHTNQAYLSDSQLDIGEPQQL